MKLWDILVDFPFSEISFVSHELSYYHCAFIKKKSFAFSEHYHNGIMGWEARPLRVCACASLEIV